MAASEPTRRAVTALPETRSAVFRYAVAVSAAVVVVGGRLILEPYVPVDHGAYITATLAVLVSAAFGGLWAGLLTTLLMAFAIFYLWMPPVQKFTLPPWREGLVLCIFAVAGALISILAERMRRAVRRAEAFALAEADARQRLQSSEEHFRRMFDEGPLGINMVDRGNRVARVNPMFCRMLGYGERELCGRTVESITDPADVGAEAALLQRVWDGLLPGFTITKRYVRKDGRTFWGTCSVAAIRDERGEAVGALGMVQDITERKRLDEALRRAKDEAEAANRAKDQFLAVLSHELRTPLSPVLLTASSMEDDPALPAAIREDLHMIRHNVELEARLIDDLLDLTGIDRGKLKLHRTLSDAHALIGQAVYMVERDIDEKRLNVRVHLDAPRAEVDADPARIEQVFWNLIKNAVKFTPAGGTITIRTRDELTGPSAPAPPAAGQPPPPPEWLVVEVSDTGVGIPPEALPKLFRAFEQGSVGVTHRFGGLGLGLAISRSIVQLHGGWIRARSEGAGRGATFSVGLPLVPAAAVNGKPVTTAVGPPPGQPAPAAEPPPRRGPLRVLLVEDHPATRRAMAAIVKAMGHEVRPAATLAEALALAEGSTFDLVISDLALPDGSGHDLMRRLKQRHRDVHGVAVSGYGMADDVQRSRDAGFDEHLTKPVSREKIREVLSHVGAA